MSQPLTKKNFAPGSLRAPRSARTLLLRMAADQERAERVRQLKADHPEIKWRMVAEHVGVTERAAQEWPKSGGIEPTNAKKLAELFDVSYEWLWFGREVVAQDGTPDPFAGQPVDLAQQLNRIEQALTDRTDHERKVDAMLQEQTEILAEIRPILAEIRRVMSGLPDEEALRLFNEGARQIAAAAEAFEAVPGASSAGQAGTGRPGG